MRSAEFDSSLKTGMPFCSAVHGELLEWVFASEGFCPTVGRASTAGDIAYGLQYVNNDACYETIALVGQAIGMVLDGGAGQVVLPKMCAHCRAMDATFFMERALRAIGREDVGVHEASDLLYAERGLSPTGQEKAAKALLLGDAIVHAKEFLGPGRSAPAARTCAELSDEWTARAKRVIEQNDDGSFYAFWEQLSRDVEEAADPDFERAPIVALVGSMPIIYDAHMNGGAIELLQREGCHVITPFLSGQVRWMLDRGTQGASKLRVELGRLRALVAALDPPFRIPATYIALRARVEGIVPAELRYGEGWKTAARFSYLAQMGVRNFVYLSTFGCLSGHVMGRGVLKWARSLAPGMNISSIEYDPGTSAVNQSNRIKLAASLARESGAQDGAAS